MIVGITREPATERTTAAARQRERDRRRNARKRDWRPHTVTRRQLATLHRELPPEPAATDWRPLTRGDCALAPRPCPFVGCRFNLYLDVTARGGLRLNFPDLDPWEMDESCVLDAVEAGTIEHERIAELLNVTRAAVHNLEKSARRKVRRLPVLQELSHV